MSALLRVSPALALLCGAAACLLPGPETLLERATAEVIVTGAELGDRLRLEAGPRSVKTVVDEPGPVHLYLELPAGEHVLALTVERGARALCHAFSVRVDPDEAIREVMSIDVRDAGACPDRPSADGGDEGPGDGGLGPIGEDERVFASLAEDLLEVPCPLGKCSIRFTRVEADGTLRVTESMGPTLQAAVSEEDIEALAAAVLSTKADRLFAGEDPACAQPRPDDLSPRVELERSTYRFEGGGARQRAHRRHRLRGHGRASPPPPGAPARGGRGVRRGRVSAPRATCGRGDRRRPQRRRRRRCGRCRRRSRRERTRRDARGGGQPGRVRRRGRRQPRHPVGRRPGRRGGLRGRWRSGRGQRRQAGPRRAERGRSPWRGGERK